MKRFTNRISNVASRMGRFVVLCAAMVSLTAAAQSTVPQVTSFYPAKAAEGSEQTVKTNAKIYVYFTAGSKVVSAEAALTQNGSNLGTVTYLSTKPAAPGNTALLDTSLAENSAMQNLAAGVFTISINKVTYIDSNGTQQTATGEFDSVNYRHPASNGKIVSETGFPNDHIQSYYAADNMDGVKVFNFDRPVLKDKINVYFEYGYGDGEQKVYYKLTNWRLSDDGKTFTFDMRGKCYNKETLAPGIIFTDVDGSELPDPTTINFIVEGLNCADGTKIETITIGPNGKSLTMEGKIFRTCSFDDLTFATPVLSSPAFYAAANPSKTSVSITSDVDHIKFSAINLEKFQSGDVKFTYGKTVAIVPWNDVTLSGGQFSCAVPATILALGSDNLEVTLVNCVYTVNDGANHTIRPLRFSTLAKEISSVADLKEMAIEEEAVLRAEDGVYVTFSRAGSLTFIEDKTGAVMITYDDEFATAFPEGAKLDGTIAGRYVGDDTFMVKTTDENTAYSSTEVGYQAGRQVTLTDLANPELRYMLVTIEATPEAPITKSGGDVIIGNEVPVITDYIENGSVVPDVIENVTGVLYTDGTSYYLLARTIGDFNRSIESVPTTVAAVKALEPGTSTDFVVNAKVTYSNVDYGMSIVEDETGAIVIYDDDNHVLEAGNIISGTISGTYFGDDTFITNLTSVELTTTPVDVTEGADLSDDEIGLEANLYRLVTRTATKECPLEYDGLQITSGERVSFVDMFEVLDYDYEMPAKITKVTGFVYPNNTASFGGEGNEKPVTVVIRSAADIVGGTSAILGLESGNNAAPVEYFNLQGVKVANPANGLYIRRQGTQVTKQTIK